MGLRKQLGHTLSAVDGPLQNGISCTGIEFVRHAMLKTWGEEHFSNANRMVFVRRKITFSASTLDVSFVAH